MESFESRPALRSLVEQTLMAAVGWGELRTGVVYGAADLAGRYSATRAQVRTSLRSLARDGLVVMVPGRGYQVTEPTADELRDLVELRLLIEVPTARQAAESGLSDEDCQTIRDLAQRTMTVSRQGDLLGYICADLDFHLQLVASGGNKELVEVVRLLRMRSRITAIRPVAAEFMIENADEHLVMAELLADGDGPGLDDLLRRHITRATDLR